MITYSVGGAQKMLAEIHEIAKLALPPSAAAVRSPLPDGAAIKAMLAQRPTTKQIEAYQQLLRSRND